LDAPLELRIAAELVCDDLLFLSIELTDPRERFGHEHGLDVLGLDEASARMRPALRVHDVTRLRNIACVSGIAVREQRAGVVAEKRRNVRARSRGKPGEGDLVAVAVQRPVVCRLHLAAGLATGLDR